MYVYCMHVSVYRSAHMHVEARGGPWVPCTITLYSIPLDRLSHGMETHWQPAGSSISALPHFPPSAGVTDSHSYAQMISTWALGI